MCGRYTLRVSGKRLAEAFGLSQEPSLFPRYNIAPTQAVPVIRVLRTNPETKERELVPLRWGLVPSWADDPAIGNRLIINIAPREGISLRVEGKVPGSGLSIDSAKLNLDYQERFGGEPMEAYGPLILVAIRGDRTDLLLRELVSELAQGALLLRQREGDTGAGCLCHSHVLIVD